MLGSSTVCEPDDSTLLPLATAPSVRTGAWEGVGGLGEALSHALPLFSPPSPCTDGDGLPLAAEKLPCSAELPLAVGRVPGRSSPPVEPAGVGGCCGVWDDGVEEVGVTEAGGGAGEP